MPFRFSSGTEFPDQYQTHTECKIKTHVAWIPRWEHSDLLLWVSDLRFWIGASRPISHRYRIQSTNCCWWDYWAAGSDQTLLWPSDSLQSKNSCCLDSWEGALRCASTVWVSDLRCWIGASGPMVLGREILGEKLVTWADRYKTDMRPIWKWSLLWKSLQNRYEKKTSRTMIGSTSRSKVNRKCS